MSWTGALPASSGLAAPRADPAPAPDSGAPLRAATKDDGTDDHVDPDGERSRAPDAERGDPEETRVESARHRTERIDRVELSDRAADSFEGAREVP
jgi:hypothetical protein